MLNHQVIEQDDEIIAACLEHECDHKTRFTNHAEPDAIRAALLEHNREHAIPCADELAAALCRATGESCYDEMSEEAKDFYRNGARAVVKEFLNQTGDAFFRFNSLTTDVEQTEAGLMVRFRCCDQSSAYPLADEARGLEIVAGHVCGEVRQ